MPTKRRKVKPRRVGYGMPEWAYHWLLTGKEPGEHDPGYDQHFGWAFCGESVPGLGRLLTEEDTARIDRLRREIRRAHKAQIRPATAPGQDQPRSGRGMA